MKSLILTSLYLFKDTTHRWKERPASALSRMLVVFFLSLCSLAFLATYVFSTKMVEDELKKNGGDSISLHDTGEGSNDRAELIEKNISKICDADTIILNEISGATATIGQKNLPIAEYSDKHLSGLADLPLNKHPYLIILPEKSPQPEAPTSFEINNYTYTMPAYRLPSEHLLNRSIWHRDGLVLIPEGTSGAPAERIAKRIIIAAKQMTYGNIAAIHDTLDNINRMDKKRNYIYSFKESLARLDLILSNQAECRAGFSIGIACIVGILLTAIASMEFRQNEYIYTLMKSFGVRPILLISTYIAENILLVGTSYIAAVIFFLESQKVVLGELFKLKNAYLSFADIEKDIYLLGASLLLCILASSIPIAASAYREIGRVLK